MSSSAPRDIAWEVLVRVERDGAWADRVLHALLGDARLERRQRAFATELSYGTLRLRGRLDAALRSILDRPLEKLDPRVRNLLRIGAYQILYLENVPVPVAVSECVRLTKDGDLGWASGLVNAVLRRLAREAKSLLLPDREADPIGYLTDACSIPHWLAERWHEELGFAEAEALATAQMSAPPRTVRLSPEADAAAVIRRLGGRVCRYAPRGITDLERDPVADPAFWRGEISVQDEASQLVPLLLGPVESQTVVDCCAAPGGKAVQLAQAVGPKGEVIALERYPARIGLIRAAQKRLGLENMRILERDASKGFDLQGQLRFGHVLVDAPCSGLGVLRRNPDARWRLRPEDIPGSAARAGELLRSAARYVEVGGALVYSVCTLTPEETRGVVDAFLETHADFAIDDPSVFLPEPVASDLLTERGELRTLPHRDGCDGFYAVRLVRGERPPRRRPLS